MGGRDYEKGAAGNCLSALDGASNSCWLYSEMERKDIVVGAGTAGTVTFSLAKDTPGSYQIGIGELTSTLIVEGIAAVEISFNPSPVPCVDEYWHWRVILTEVNGTGVKLNSLVYDRYEDVHLVDTLDYDSAWIETWLDSAYLPAYGSEDFGAGFPCQEVDYAVFTVTGTDDNGYNITATGRVDFVR